MKSIDFRSKASRLNITFLVCALIVGCSEASVAKGVSDGTDAPKPTVTSANSNEANVVGTQLDTGKRLFQYWCSSCHAPGPGHPGTQALAQKYGGKRPDALEERTDLAPNLTKYYVRTGVSIMPFFRKTEIDDGDLDALALYLARTIPAPAK